MELNKQLTVELIQIIGFVLLLCLDLQDEEEYIYEHQPFPSLSQV